MDRQLHTKELLQLLDSDVADTILARLDPEIAARLRSQLTTETDQAIRPKQQRMVLDEFERFFEFAVRNGLTQPDLHVADEEPDEDETEEEEPEEDLPPPFELNGDPLHDLGSLTSYQLALALETEQARTAAILLSNLPSAMAADALSHMTAEHQSLVIRELSREQHAPPVLVERIARATLTRGQSISTTPPDRRDHSDRLADMLRGVPKTHRGAMMEAIEEEDADLSKVLLKKMYRFEDITSLEGRVVQRVLGEVDSGTLTSALFGVDPAIAGAILGNLSRRARQAIEEELQFQSHVPESRVNQARDTIAEIIAKIDQESE